MNVLKGLTPAPVFRHFEAICAIPHGSGNTRAVSDYCADFARSLGLRFRQDEHNNIIIWKNGTPGYEDAAPVMIQGHLDMVCEKDADCPIDMAAEGLHLRLEDGILSAEGTTLGGDDGIAVAYGLALLESTDLPHPPLEVVFTVDEEIGMLGADALDMSDLRSRILLNVDSEQEGELLVSGLYDSQALGWRVTRAAGRITARTEHTFLVEIPWKYEKKEYRGAPIIQKKLIFFEKEIKLFKNSSILGSSCDKISNIDTFTLGNGVSLPFSVLTERYLPYDYVIGERDPAQAEALAYYELERQITQCMPDAILLKKEITASLTEDAFVIKCKVRALENIAEVMEFSVDERRPLS
jgi:hypothetical protein